MNFQENACQYFDNKFSAVQSQENFPTSCRPILNIIQSKDCVNYKVTINFGWHMDDFVFIVCILVA
jgi:hypothetical protein